MNQDKLTILTAGVVEGGGMSQKTIDIYKEIVERARPNIQLF